MNQQTIVGAHPTGTLAQPVAVQVEIGNTHLERLNAVAVQVDNDRGSAAFGVVGFWGFFFLLFFLFVVQFQKDAKLAICEIIDGETTIDYERCAIENIGITATFIGIFRIGFLSNPAS